MTDPVFTGVTVSSTAAGSTASQDGNVQFLCTYSPAAIANGNKACLFLGGDNTLFYPAADNYQVGSLRAYFKVNLGNGLGVYPAPSQVRQFVLNFGDEADGIVLTDFTDSTDRAGAWFTLDGQRLNGKPTAKGLYINNGHKIIIK